MFQNKFYKMVFEDYFWNSSKTFWNEFSWILIYEMCSWKSFLEHMKCVLENFSKWSLFLFFFAFSLLLFFLCSVLPIFFVVLYNNSGDVGGGSGGVE